MTHLPSDHRPSLEFGSFDQIIQNKNKAFKPLDLRLTLYGSTKSRPKMILARSVGKV